MVSGLQAADDVRHRVGALVARLQVYQEPSAVERDIVAVHADEGRQALHVRVGENGRRELLLALGHRRIGDTFTGLGNALDEAGVLVREEALGHEQSNAVNSNVAAATYSVGRW